MINIWVLWIVEILDLLCIICYCKLFEFGFCILFFSGGLVINGVCQVFKEYIYNFIYFVILFDFGGSFVILCKVF